MNSLYKRFVTMCMISISALLAWIYCLFEFRDKPLYIAAISLVLVISVYALFMAAYKIKVSKDAQMEQYISNTLNSMLSSMSKNDNEELERLSKALYVQLRKSNSILSQMAEDHNESSNNTQNLISESINKAVKLSVKYNQLNNNKLIESSTEVSNELTNTYKDLVNTLNKLNSELIVLRNTAPSKVPFDNEESASSLNSLDIFNEEAYVSDSLSDSTTQDEVTPDITEADVIPFPVAESIPEVAEEAFTDETFDPNKPMSPEEIAALFASMEPAAEPAKEPEPEPVDPNRPMSPEEIAALFASMDAANEPAKEPEPIPEPEPAPADVDPNKPLSPEEIAALFASMQ